MTRNRLFNRRAFLREAGTASACIMLPGNVLASVAGSGNNEHAHSRYVLRTAENCIEVLRSHGGRWTSLQKVTSQAPSSLVLHPNQQFLYAANAVALHEGLPQGTVEVYAIRPQSGLLSLLQRQALSLSGTEPRSLAITPDGLYLLAALYGGGAYNVLSIQQDGQLTAVRQVFKELGSGLHPGLQRSSHPHTIMFDRSGRFLLASDFGCDHLSVFELTHSGELKRQSKHPISPGAGPGSIAFSPDGSSLYLMHELAGAISCHRYHEKAAILENAFQIVPLPRAPWKQAPARGALEMHSSGRFLSAHLANGLTVWTIGSSGELTFLQQPALS